MFELLTDPTQIPRWWPIIRAFEPHVGGTFELGEEGWLIVGRVTELERPRVLSYTWRCLSHPAGRDPGDEQTIVRFELLDSPQGTAVHLTHSGFATEDQRRGTAAAQRVGRDGAG